MFVRLTRDGDGKINEHVEAGEKVDETLWGNPKSHKRAVHITEKRTA